MASCSCFYMAGGKGERFWPLSTTTHPKHLQKLFDGKTLMELSLERSASVFESTNTFIVTSAPQKPAMQEVVGEMATIIAEPQPRDTAAAVALSARWAQLNDPQGVMAMLPADHLIRDYTAFGDTLNKAIEIATASDVLVTIGISPSFPATTYGYLKQGEKFSERSYRVDSFREKPDAATAQAYLVEGGYCWNAGMFVWSVPTIVKALEKYTPELWAALKDIDVRQPGVLESIYPTLPKISIDYAVMEKADNIVMLPASFDWSDVGTWDSYAQNRPADGAGNSLEGEGVTAVECQKSLLINTDNSRTLAAFGLDDMVVVQTSSQTLIMPKAKSAELKKLLKEI